MAMTRAWVALAMHLATLAAVATVPGGATPSCAGVYVRVGGARRVARGASCAGWVGAVVAEVLAPAVSAAAVASLLLLVFPISEAQAMLAMESRGRLCWLRCIGGCCYSLIL